MWDNTKSTLPSYIYDNECYYLYISGQWISPDVTGSRPPPCEDFTLLSISGNRVVLYGGSNPDTLFGDRIYISKITGYQLVSVLLIVNILLVIKLIIM